MLQVDIVRSITDKKTSISSGVAKILETISSYDNIPRKKAKFLNFMKNSFRYMKLNELEEAWTLLEGAMKESKAENAAIKNSNAKEPHANGQSEQTNGKRKLEDEETLGEETLGEEKEAANGTEEPQKKKKSETNGTEQQAEELIAKEQQAEEPIAVEKFSWSETIRNYLLAKNNEVKLRKLRGKVIKKYQNLTGSEWSDKVENKFNKKINKLKGVVVDNEKVRLIA